MNIKEFKKKYPDKEFGLVTVTRLYDYGNDHSIIDRGCNLELCHECGEWDIGDVEEAKDLIKDLKNAINYAESVPRTTK